MAKKKDSTSRTWDEANSWLKDHGFDLLEPAGVQNRVFLKKDNCSAAIEKVGDDGIKIFAYPGCLVNGEIAKLVNKGYQQFFKTTKAEVPATSDRLTALHHFSEELKEAMGALSLYNESLGTVSTDYFYDRVAGRDHGEQHNRPWEGPPQPNKVTTKTKKPA